MKKLKFKKLTTVDHDTANLDGSMNEKIIHHNEILEVQSIEETVGRSYVDLWMEDGSILLDVPKNTFEVLA